MPPTAECEGDPWAAHQPQRFTQRADSRTPAARTDLPLGVVRRRLVCMTIEVDLPEEALRRLRAEADRRGLSVEGLIAELASEFPGAGSGPGRRPAFVAVGASEAGTTDRIEEILAEGFGRD